MLTTMFTMIVLCQTPASDARPTPQATKPAARAKGDYSDVIARKKAMAEKKNARAAAGRLSERQQAAAALAAARAQQAEYERMLPFMLEQQRQQLDRMSAVERNAALHRMARAMESEASTYQWATWKAR